MWIHIILISVLLNNLQADLDSEWKLFKEKYNKRYKTEADEGLRRNIFKESLKFIEEHNSKRSLQSFQIELNEFADLTDDEFKKMYLSSDHFTNKEDFNIKETSFKTKENEAPDSINWIGKGYMNPVLHQGSCGSCYAFGATAAIEAHYYIKTKNLIQLSQQEVMDCSKSIGNNGCGGGLTSRTFQYALENGIGFESNNPYLAVEGECIQTQPRLNISGIFKVPNGDEEILKQIVGTLGPVAFGYDAGWPSFKFYKTGVYFEPECRNYVLSHAMVIVGYGNENGQDYWLVRNSWGKDWGENGNFKAIRNKNNTCGIATRALYPVV